MSGWVNATVELSDRSASDVLDHVEDNIKFEIVDSRKESHRLLIGINSRGKAGRKKLADQLSDALSPDIAERFIVVSANDTTCSGNGVLYEHQDDEYQKIETKHGYEGANANDVAGYFRENYDFNPAVRSRF